MDTTILVGGVDIQKDKTFFEFSEIIGYGEQETVAMSTGFTGKWKGPGVKIDLQQKGARVTGCYDNVGKLSGTVSRNLLHATGAATRSNIPSTFVLAIGANGEITGVRFTNGAPFKLYNGHASPTLKTNCTVEPAKVLGCGSIIHGIHFDSAAIKSASGPLLDALAAGLKAESASRITIVGHTSSEGADEYNQKLSQRRADAAVTAIAARGIAGTRMTADGRGESQPLADNVTATGRSLNRRVEIVCQ